jgi:hypothetical protein
MSEFSDVFTQAVQKAAAQGEITPVQAQSYLDEYKRTHPGGVLPYLEHAPLVFGAPFAAAELGAGAGLGGADAAGAGADAAATDAGAGAVMGSTGGLNFGKILQYGLAGLGAIQGAQSQGKANQLMDQLIQQMGERQKLGKLLMAKGAVGNPFSGQYGALQ